ncbi:hypothetical protein DFH09DRAFT_1096905 [Mycena vulgaris]|nr:hypothetical protein DFH09DRAFT_1096905 [Mycena vulgaris]
MAQICSACCAVGEPLLPSKPARLGYRSIGSVREFNGNMEVEPYANGWNGRRLSTTSAAHCPPTPILAVLASKIDVHPSGPSPESPALEFTLYDRPGIPTAPAILSLPASQLQQCTNGISSSTTPPPQRPPQHNKPTLLQTKLFDGLAQREDAAAVARLHPAAAAADIRPFLRPISVGIRSSIVSSLNRHCLHAYPSLSRPARFDTPHLQRPARHDSVKYERSAGYYDENRSLFGLGLYPRPS